MARKPKPQDQEVNTTVTTDLDSPVGNTTDLAEATETKSDDEVTAEANALAVAEAVVAEAVVAEATHVSVRAKFNRMRNPYTGAVFTKSKSTDVIDLNSKENTWTRDQIAAKVLEIV